MPDAFRVDGLGNFLKALESFGDMVEADVNSHVQGLAYSLTYSLIMETPQYSGAAASAWRVGIGSPDYITEKPEYYVPATVKDQSVVESAFSKRHRNMQAVYDALMACSANIAAYTIGQGPMYISNGLDYVHWFEQDLHDAGSPLRQQNLPHRKVNQVVQGALDSPSTLRF